VSGEPLGGVPDDAQPDPLPPSGAPVPDPINDPGSNGDDFNPENHALGRGSVSFTETPMTLEELASVQRTDKIWVSVTTIGAVIVAGLSVAAIISGREGVGDVGIFLGIPVTIILALAALKAWSGARGDLVDKKTMWVRGAIGLSDRLNWMSRYGDRICTLWFGEKSLDIDQDLYKDLKSRVAEPTPKGRRPMFDGAVQYVPSSGLLLRVRDSRGGAIYERPSLLASDGTGPVKGLSVWRGLLILGGLIAVAGLMAWCQIAHRP
jgi:hypothetical protein